MPIQRELPWRGWIRVMGEKWRYVLDFQPGEDEVKAIASLFMIARDKAYTIVQNTGKNVIVSVTRLPLDETPTQGGILEGKR